MKCTLVISDWEMNNDFLDYLSNAVGTPILSINERDCLVDSVRVTYADNKEGYMMVECHRALNAN